MSTHSLIWEMIWLKLENRSMALIGNVVTMSGFTDKQCVVWLISEGGCSNCRVGGQAGLVKHKPQNSLLPRALHSIPRGMCFHLPLPCCGQLWTVSFTKWLCELERVVRLESNRLGSHFVSATGPRHITWSCWLSARSLQPWRLLQRPKWSDVGEILLHDAWHTAGLWWMIVVLLSLFL